MTDKCRRRRTLSEEELEDLLRGLPHRGPAPYLRGRILAATVPAPRPAGLRRPAFALAALAALVLADLLVLQTQGSFSAATPASAAVAGTQAPSREEIALLRDLGSVDLPLRIASQRSSRPASAFELRARILNELGGG